MKELEGKSVEELTGMIRERKTRMVELRMLVRQNKVKNVKEIASARKDIARIKTILSSPHA